jgi:hypothetical protein
MQNKDVEKSDLEIPDWLERGTVRYEPDAWSEASSDAEDAAEDVARIDELDAFPDPNEKYDVSPIEEEEKENVSNSTQELISDLEEAFGLRTPLQMRYTPDGTHCIATWNMNNGFDAETIVKVMLQCNISILFIQEPKKKVTKVDTGFMNRALLKYGLKAYFSQHQFLIYNDATLGARVQDVKCDLDGRIITCYVQIGEITSKNYIKITGCYAIPQGDFI